MFTATTPLLPNLLSHGEPSGLDTYGSMGCVWPMGWRLSSPNVTFRNSLHTPRGSFTIV